MDVQLLKEALIKFFAGFVIVGLLVFVPAGTLRYPGGLLFMGCLFVPMFVAGLVMLARNPRLLRSRLDAREEQGDQRTVVALSGILFMAVFVVAGLSFRFGWLTVPGSVQHAAAIVFLAAYALYGEVLRENTYLSRTIEVQEGQKVIDTGLYGIVRHPMYAATLILFLSMGWVLGSPLSFAVLLLYVPIIAKRMKNEEKVLEAGLQGYTAYKQKVEYKVIPHVW